MLTKLGLITTYSLALHLRPQVFVDGLERTVDVLPPVLAVRDGNRGSPVRIGNVVGGGGPLRRLRLRRRRHGAAQQSRRARQLKQASAAKTGRHGKIPPRGELYLDIITL